MSAPEQTTQESSVHKPKVDIIDPRVVWGTKLMDDFVKIPGTNIGLGLDGLLGLIPVFGDAVTLLFSSKMLHEAKRLGAPKTLQAKMITNYVIDFIAGLVPVVGDVLDFAFKANRKNLEMLQKFLEEKARNNQEK